MKKIILLVFTFITAWISSSSVAYSQTLTFSRVIFLDSNVISCQSCWTVPAGKVWKVVSLGGANGGATSGFINGESRGYFTSRLSNQNEVYNSFRLPLWLPAGAVFGFAGGGSTTWFSVIEFTVTP